MVDPAMSNLAANKSKRAGRWNRASPGAALVGVALLAALATGLIAVPASAQQYRTQIMPVPESQAQPSSTEDLQQQLKTLTGNPYGKSLTLRALAGRAVAAGDYASARRYLEEIVRLQALSKPALAEIRGNLAQLQAQAGEYQKVIDTMAPLLARGVKNEVVSPQAWLALGAAYARTGQWGKAVEPMRRASQVGSPSEAMYRLQLAVYMQAGRLGSAAEVLEKLVGMAPGNKAYWLQLAAVQSQRKHYHAAVATLEIALRRGMLETTGERMRLVRAYRRSGAPYDAASQLAAWMQAGVVADNTANQKRLAVLWTEANEFARAIKPLSRAARATGDPALYAQLGQLHMDMAQWQAAAQAFERAEAHGGIGNRTGDLMLSLGLAYYQRSREDLARQAFQKARSHAGSASLARQWLAFLEAKPPELEPFELQGLSGVGGQAVAPTAGETPGRAGAVQEPTRPLPDSVPETGDRLTPVGAVRAGNADGTIPPWTGGITPARAPASYQPGERLVNPFADEQPRLVITSANVDRYRKLLSAGHEALFRRYPDYRMLVYPSHRTAAYPEAIYKATLANQGRAHLETPDVLEGAHLGFPFRKPQTGVEVMWNHRLRYRGNNILIRSDEAVVGNEGIHYTQRRIEKVLFGYGNLSRPAGINANIIAYYLMSIIRDGRRQFTALAHETLNDLRRIWVSVPQAPRLFRVPPVGYDNPRPGSDGLMLIDQIDMYNGNFDRYVWRLLGRREVIVPYNAYGLQATDISYRQLLAPGHPDPRYMRYERHRVWIVEATERPGAEHVFGKRVFYVDEDTWSILMVDNYDDAGRIWRFQEGHPVQNYHLQLTFTGPVFIYDLKTGRYFATHLTNEAPGVFYNSNPYQPGDFRPAAVRRMVH